MLHEHASLRSMVIAPLVDVPILAIVYVQLGMII